MRKILLLLIPLLISIFSLNAQQIQESALKQILSLQQEKESRTPAQKKLDSQLWYAAKQERGDAITSAVSTLNVNVNRAPDGRVPVEISGKVTPALLQAIKAAGGEITFTSEKFESVSAKIPVLNLEKIAT